MYGIQPADSAIMSAREPCRTPLVCTHLLAINLCTLYKSACPTSTIAKYCVHKYNCRTKIFTLLRPVLHKDYQHLWVQMLRLRKASVAGRHIPSSMCFRTLHPYLVIMPTCDLANFLNDIHSTKVFLLAYSV